MAETCAKAFGRYLKTLRERRGLALDDVAKLSQSYADPVAKSYLSRVENGIFSLALSKMIPLCRIYEIPVEALVERLELDIELDRVGSPDTKGLTFGVLLKKGKAAHEQGMRWHAYAYYRDAAAAAQVADADHGPWGDERPHYALLAVASAADNLGRYRFAINELLTVYSVESRTPRLSALLLDRMASVYLHSGDLAAARRWSESAIGVAKNNALVDLVGFFYSDRAAISRKEGDFTSAISFHQKAIDAFRAAGRDIECSRSFHALAIAYFSASRYGAARRAVEAADRLAALHGQTRITALVRLMLGDLDLKAGNSQKASTHWQGAAEIAKSLGDPEIQFQATFSLFCQARDGGDRMRARSLQRQLAQLASLIRTDIPELAQFRSVSHSA